MLKVSLLVDGQHTRFYKTAKMWMKSITDWCLRVGLARVKDWIWISNSPHSSEKSLSLLAAFQRDFSFVIIILLTLDFQNIFFSVERIYHVHHTTLCISYKQGIFKESGLNFCAPFTWLLRGMLFPSLSHASIGMKNVKWENDCCLL